MATLSVERFLERIARGKLAPAIFLLGSDVYLRELCRRKIVEEIGRASCRERV